MMPATVPFKTPVDYFNDLLGGDPANINRFYERWRARSDWRGYDEDLHVYPYIHALPCALTLGCPNKCPFCPTAWVHKGRVHRGDPELILRPYAGRAVHFMDENFFLNNADRLPGLLDLLRDLNITWLAMTDAISFIAALANYGEARLVKSGLQVVEVGLENAALYRKVPAAGIPTKVIDVYYLNMTFFPGETKATIKENAAWMNHRSLRRPIHHNNGLWYAPGQFLFDDRGQYKDRGITLEGQPVARTRPTFIPRSFLDERIRIRNLEFANYNGQLVYGLKFYPDKTEIGVEEFCGGDWRKFAWLVVGLRCGAME